MTFSNHPVTPNTVMAAALIMNAATASPMPCPAPATASTAAPGVLQATMTGLRSQSEGRAEHNPMPRPSAHIHELMTSGVAPKACAAWKTMATELVKPTSTATKPAVKAERLRSLKKRMGRDSARPRRGALLAGFPHGGGNAPRRRAMGFRGLGNALHRGCHLQRVGQR